MFHPRLTPLSLNPGAQGDNRPYMVRMEYHDRIENRTEYQNFSKRSEVLAAILWNRIG